MTGTIVPIREDMYYLLECRVLFPKEQKRGRKRVRWTGWLLYMDLHKVKAVKIRWKHMAVSWIDYKKIYDMVLQNWMIDWPLPPTVCSTLYSKYSSRACVFSKNAGSSALSAFVIVSARYDLFLSYFLAWSHFLLLDLLTFVIRNLDIIL